MLGATARVYQFPDRSAERNHLTVRDKLDLHSAGQRIVAAGFRCVIGREREGLCHDFVQLVPSEQAVVAWTLVREGPAVRVWRGVCGADLGGFATFAEALDATLSAAFSQTVRLPAADAPH